MVSRCFKQANTEKWKLEGTEKAVLAAIGRLIIVRVPVPALREIK